MYLCLYFGNMCIIQYSALCDSFYHKLIKSSDYFTTDKDHHK